MDVVRVVRVVYFYCPAQLTSSGGTRPILPSMTKVRDMLYCVTTIVSRIPAQPAEQGADDVRLHEQHCLLWLQLDKTWSMHFTMLVCKCMHISISISMHISIVHVYMYRWHEDGADAFYGSSSTHSLSAAAICTALFQAVPMCQPKHGCAGSAASVMLCCATANSQVDAAPSNLSFAAVVLAARQLPAHLQGRQS